MLRALDDPEILAGQVDVAETPGAIVDMAPSSSLNVIYKTDSIFTMHFIGPPQIFSFNEVTRYSGLANQQSLVDLPIGQVALLLDDLVIVDVTGGVQSILESSMRNYIFERITDLSTVFLLNNYWADEVWMCVPRAEDTLCVIWNHKHNTFALHSYPPCRAGTTGPPIEQAGAVLHWNAHETDIIEYLTADDDVLRVGNDDLIFRLSYPLNTTYHEFEDVTWADGNHKYADIATPVFAGVVAGQDKLYHATRGHESLASSYLERTGYALVGQDRAQTLVTDLDSDKFVRAVRLRVKAGNGQRFRVQLGSQLDQNTPVVYNDEETLTVAAAKKSYVMPLQTVGRLIALRITAQNFISPWELIGYDLDIEVVSQDAA